MSTLYVDNLQPNLGSRVMAAGHVVQVVHSTQSGNNVSSVVTSYTDTGLSVSITPTSASSKILVFASTIVAVNDNDSTKAARFDLRLTNADASEIAFQSRYQGTDYQYIQNLSPLSSPHGYFSPASTAQQTYKVQARIAAGTTDQGEALYLSWYAGSIQTITAMEIAQ